MALMNGSNLPEQLEQLRHKFKAVFTETGRGSHRLDLLDFDGHKVVFDRQSTLSPNVRQLIQDWMSSRNRNFEYDISNLQCCRSFESFGLTFATSGVSPRNSNVIIGHVPELWSAGEIKHIVTVQSQSTSTSELSGRIIFVLQIFDELDGDDICRDPYRRFPIAGGRIFYDTCLRSKLLIVPSDEILCHFVRTTNVVTTIARAHFHALPLDKVLEFIPSTPCEPVNKSSAP